MLLLKIDWTQAQVLAAGVTGLVTIALAFWSFFIGRINQKETKKTQHEFEDLKNEFSKDMELLKTELAEKKAENDARRVYEFEARKRLYHEYEPLLFQLMEASDNALHRIQSLARTARHGNLNEDGWLAQFNYYTKSTIYKLFVPLAIYQIMQRKLTLVDVSVDKFIGLHYKLIKQVYISYTDDFEFARNNPELFYDPNHKDWPALRKENPASYWRQGLPMGLLDKTIEFLIKAQEKERVITYGEFERKISDVGNNELSDVNLAKDIFYLFHPVQRPVLWRVLITQAIIFRTLLELRKVDRGKISDELVAEVLFDFDDKFFANFNWQTQEESLKIIEEPFIVAKDYLSKRF